MAALSWIYDDNKVCKDCGFEIVVTQPIDEKIVADYYWYCSNPLCKNHTKGEHTGDMEEPSFITEGNNQC